MNSVQASPFFKRKIKPLVKKYHTLKESILNLGKELIKNPYLGESYGSNIYKIRLADESKGKGKSGGFRVLYYLTTKYEDRIIITLLTIYSKSEVNTISKKEADQILKQAIDEIDMGI